MLQVELLNIVKHNKGKYLEFAVDEMAAQRCVIILRLPPYHCELNPIELI